MPTDREPAADWICELPIAPGIRAFATGRGVVDDDSGPYDSFSLCHYTGDTESHVSHCRRMLAREIGISPDRIIVPRQTHDTRCLVIGSLPVESDSLYGVDALVTRLEGVAIGVSTADCVPLLLADPRARVIAAVHAGWRGCVAGVVEHALAAMESLGAVAAHVMAVTGPAIGPCCFEVGEEVAARFPRECVDRTHGHRPHVDLPRAVAMRLADGGIPAANIALSSVCTRCDTSRYFSARYLGAASGRNFTFLFLD